MARMPSLETPDSSGVSSRPRIASRWAVRGGRRGGRRGDLFAPGARALPRLHQVQTTALASPGQPETCTRCKPRAPGGACGPVKTAEGSIRAPRARSPPSRARAAPRRSDVCMGCKSLRHARADPTDQAPPWPLAKSLLLADHARFGVTDRGKRAAGGAPLAGDLPVWGDLAGSPALTGSRALGARGARPRSRSPRQ